MKITIEPTPTLTRLHGQEVRLWNGVTDQGIPCQVFVAAVAVAETENCAAFEQTLAEIPAPLGSVPLWHLAPGRPGQPGKE